MARRAFITGEFFFGGSPGLLLQVKLHNGRFCCPPLPFLTPPPQRGGLLLLVNVVWYPFMACPTLPRVETIVVFTLFTFWAVPMAVLAARSSMMRFDILFRALTYAPATLSKRFVSGYWLLAAVIPLLLLLLVATSTAPLLWVLTPAFTPPRAPPSPSPRPAPD